MLLILTTLHKMSTSSLWEPQEQHLYSITENKNEAEDLEESSSIAPQGIQGQVINDEGVASLLEDLKTGGSFGILSDDGFYMNVFGLQVEGVNEKTEDENDDDVEGGGE